MRKSAIYVCLLVLAGVGVGVRVANQAKTSKPDSAATERAAAPKPSAQIALSATIAKTLSGPRQEPASPQTSGHRIKKPLTQAASAKESIAKEADRRAEQDKDEKADEAEEAEAEEKAAEEKGAFDSPDEAEAYYLQRRLPPGQTRFPRERYGFARERMANMPAYSTALDQYVNVQSLSAQPQAAGRGDGSLASSNTLGSWTALGPGNIGGRTRAILVHPVTPSIMYAAGVSGGVWKTTDSGASWVPLNDLMANLSVSALVFAPTDPNIIYAGTGEGFYNSDAQRGNGIFKTTDGGTNWTQLAASDTSDLYRVNDLAVSKSDANRVYAATRLGVYRTLDGGTSWSQILNIDADFGGTNGSLLNGGCSDISMRLDGGVNTDYIFVACGGMNGRTHPARIYRSTDAGAVSPAFTTVFTEANMGRTSVAIAPSAPATVYAVSASIETGDFRNGLLAVYQSTQSGDSGSWTAKIRNSTGNKLSTLLFSNPREGLRTECGTGTSAYLNQGWYDNVLAVDPSNAAKVWVGGVDLFRSDDSGASWGLASRWQVSSSAHADQHAIVFHPQYNGTSNKTMFVGNDGGIYRTDDALAALQVTVAPGDGACNATSSSFTWTKLNNNYAVTQFYHGMPFPDGMSYMGGTQDNGTIKGTDAGGNVWSALLGGDGSYVAIDPNNTNILYAGTQNFGFSRSTNGASFTSMTSGTTSETGFLFITPFVMDPSDSTRLWTGGNKIWRTTNSAGLWEQASTTLPNVPNSSAVQQVTALAVATGDGNKVLIGTTGGAVFRNTAALSATSATEWASATLRASGGFVSWIAFDPTNADVVYATMSSFLVSPGDGHVFKSTNGGANWSVIDGTGNTAIPDIPVHSIIVDPTNTQRLFVGTDLGVFVSLDGGVNWARENTGFANVVTESLAIATRQGVPNLFAFTHGRGAWRVPLAAALAPSAAFSNASVPFGNALVGYGAFTRYVTVSNSGNAAMTISSIVVSGSGDFSRTHNCPGSLAVSASCTVTVLFNPTGSIAKSGTLTITTNAPSSPHVIPLTGTPVSDLTFVLSRPSRPTRSGAPASSVYELTITPAAGVSGVVSMSCSGKEADVSCSVQPGSVMIADGPVSAKVTVKLAARSLRLSRGTSVQSRTLKLRATVHGVTRTVELPVQVAR